MRNLYTNLVFVEPINLLTHVTKYYQNGMKLWSKLSYGTPPAKACVVCNMVSANNPYKTFQAQRLRHTTTQYCRLGMG